MIGRFPLYTDADVRGPLIKALKNAGCDVLRAIRRLPGVIAWWQKVYEQMTYGEILECFEDLARQVNPFAGYPILRIKPKR